MKILSVFLRKVANRPIDKRCTDEQTDKCRLQHNLFGGCKGDVKMHDGCYVSP